ncbi:sigma-70 family RNA polymerase sigma factor [Stutzerimonas azotifigens]|uniref:sigma-70 family RNA polymerase sigma factor n=1 Tax=Stutzerimonas azotifigens TaxID=291995 RepID=UPI00042371AE|nr:sigma-70 family RNA polymerase sigma factor [Stutzerimonas azotifigens]
MATDGVLGRHELQRFYADHHRWLHGWLRRQLGCRDNAADLAQDTFVRLLAREQDLRAIREPRAYLHAIARGLLLNHWRRRRIEQAYLEALAARPEPCAPSPERRALIIEALLEIDRLLSGLPEKARRAFLLSQLEGLTYAAIGAELGVSERMVKKYMAQAMFACLNVEPLAEGDL